LLIGTALTEEREATIAVATEGQNGSAKISMVAARAPFFLIFNKKVSLLEVIDNPCVDAKGGAGPRSADLLTGKKVNVVIAGHCRQKMITILTTQKNQFVERQGIAIRTVEEQAHAE